jgi:hypothetical protein
MIVVPVFFCAMTAYADAHNNYTPEYNINTQCRREQFLTTVRACSHGRESRLSQS